MPILDLKTEKADVSTLKSTTSLNLLFNRNRIISLVNKFKFSTYGKMLIVSGGYLCLKCRYLSGHAFEVYPYAEPQRTENKGTNHRTSAGLQSRYRLISTKCSLMFAAAGLFLEYEEWQHPTLGASTPEHAYSRSIKAHLSPSYKLQLTRKWTLTTTGIYQIRPDSIFNRPRYGGAAGLTCNITPTVSIVDTHRLIYDTDPTVPVRKDYSTMEVAFNTPFQFDDLLMRLTPNQQIIIIFTVQTKHYLSTNI